MKSFVNRYLLLRADICYVIKISVMNSFLVPDGRGGVRV